MNEPRRTPEQDVVSVAGALATAFGRPVVLAWESPPGTGYHRVDLSPARSGSDDLTMALADITEDGPTTLTTSTGHEWLVATATVGERVGPDDRLRAHVAVPASPDTTSPPVDALAAHAGAVASVLHTLIIHHRLEDAQERIGFILDNSADIIVVFRPDGTAEYVTPSVERVLGWSLDELDGRSAFDLLHPDEADEVIASLSPALEASDERRTGRFRFLRRDGSWAWLEARAVVAPRRRDVAVVSARDVTQEVEARAQAEAEEARYRTLVESSPQPIAMIQDETFVYANQAAARLLGVDDAHQVVGQSLDRFTAVEPQVDQRRIEALEHGRVMEPFEAPITRLDGSQVVVELTHIPTTWNGRPAVQVVAVDLTERRRTESLLAHSALHDPVSGLPNRNLLADRVEQAIRRARRTGERSALLFCDIDHFKVVNDALGHDTGDQVLIEVANRLRTAVRETDTVARFGGDEMVILSHDLSHDEDIDRLVGRIRDAFTDPFDVDGRSVHLTVSIGVAHIHGGERRDELMSLAESAMFAAKDNGRNRSVVADEQLLTRTGERLRIQSELHASLASGNGLSLHLQPALDLASGRTVGFEALIRFTTSDRNPVPPDRFLPIAADAGLMHRIGGFVITETARTLARLPPPVAGAWIAINASAEELEHPEFATQIARALDESGLRGDQLCIEITEHSIMRDPTGTASTLKPLRDQGVAIAIDDFGTGYSSLAYLARFQPEYLKIDRSFVADIATQPTQLAIVEGVLHLAESLGLITVAEGIETAEQAELLRELGCQLGQGWFFARPAPIDDALDRQS